MGGESIQTISVDNTPYPYKAAIAFTTDIDNSSFLSFIKSHKCFYGLDHKYRGVNLELANSAWLVCDQEHGDFGLATTHFRPLPQADLLARYYRTSLFDTLHAYGQFPDNYFSRDIATQCLHLAEDNDLSFNIWSYHGSAKQSQNFWKHKEYWSGDDPLSPCYHFDLLNRTDVQFFRMPPSRNIYDTPPLLGIDKTRDGQSIFILNACSFLHDRHIYHEATRHLETNYPHIFNNPKYLRIFIQPTETYKYRVQTWRPEMLTFQLSDDIIRLLVSKGINASFAQHFSTIYATGAYDNVDTIRLLNKLTALQNDRTLLVTTTARLAWFELVKTALQAVMLPPGTSGEILIDLPGRIFVGPIQLDLTPDLLQGISFSVKGVRPVGISIDGVSVRNVEAGYDNGEWTIAIPWQLNVDDQRETLLRLEAEARAAGFLE